MEVPEQGDNRLLRVSGLPQRTQHADKMGTGLIKVGGEVEG